MSIPSVRRFALALRLAGALLVCLGVARGSDYTSPSENTDGCGYTQESQKTSCDCCTDTPCKPLADEVSCLDGVASKYFPLAFEFLHDAYDFRIQATPEMPAARGRSCSSCGGALPTLDGRLPALEIQRLHRLRGFWLESSLGLGVFLNYDRRVRLFPLGHRDVDGAAEPVMRLFDPRVMIQHQELYERDPAIGDAAIDGVLHARDRVTSEARLRNATGATVPLSALAKGQRFSVAITGHDGAVTTYEVINAGAAASTADPDPVPEWHARVVRIADRNGNAVTLAYVHDALADDAALGWDRTRLWQLATVTDAYGRTASFTYLATKNPFWRIKSIGLPTGRTLTYHYGSGDANNRLSGVSHPDGTASSFAEVAGTGELGNLTLYQIHDAMAEPGHQRKTIMLNKHVFWSSPGVLVPSNAYMTRRIVNGDGELVMRNWMQGGSGATPIYWTYIAPGRLIRQTTDDTGVRELAEAVAPFDPATQLPWEVAFQVVRTFERDASGHATKSVDALGRSRVAVRAAASAMVTSLTHPDGTVTSTTFNAFRQPLVQIDRLGRRSERTYDARGNLLTRREAVGTPVAATTETWTYNTRGQPTSRSDALGRVTSYAYHADGRLAAITDPPDVAGGVRAVWGFVYDTAGRLSQTVDPQGRTVAHAYDASERLVSRTFGDGSQERFEFGTATAPGLLTRSVDRDGQVTTYEYDATTRVTRTVVAAGTPVASIELCTYVPGTHLEASCSVAGDRIEHRYDVRRNRIATITRPTTLRALTDSWRYDVLGRLLQETDAYGRRTFLVLDADDRVVRRVAEWIPNALGTLDPATVARTTGANPGFVVTERILDAEGQATAEIDGVGVRTTLVRDGRGRVAQKIIADRRGSNRTTLGVIEPEAQRTVNTYDAVGNLTRVDHPRSFVRDAVTGAFSAAPEGAFATTWTFNGRDRRASETVAAGLDGAGLARPERATRSWTYTLTGKVATERDFRGNATTFAYGACCDRVVSVTDAAGFVSTFGYDAGGDQVSRTDPLGQTTTFVFDARHRLITETDPSGRSTTLVYDDDAVDGVGLSATYAAWLAGLDLGAGSDGAMIEIRNAAGETTVAVSDGAGRIVRTLDGLRQATTTVHDTMVGGLLETQVRDPLGSLRRSRVDGGANVREVWDEEGRRELLATFDAAGHQLSERDADGVVTTCVFDALGRDVRCTDGLGAITRRAYDRHGNVVSSTDALGQVTTHGYDARDRKVRTTDRVAGVTRFTWSPTSRPTAVVDAEGRATTYAYAPTRDLLVTETFPGHGAVGDPTPADQRQYVYDGVGRLIARTDQAGQTTGYLYDAAGRLINRTYPDGLNDRFAHDAAGRLVTAESLRYANRVTRSYDAAGRLIREVQRLGGVDHAVAYAHDAADRAIRVTHPSGAVVTRAFDRRGLLTRATFAGATVATLAYTPGGRLSTRTTATTTPRVETRGYRADGLLASISTPGIQGLAYAYDAIGRKTQEQNGLFADETQAFSGYDGEGRLTRWQRATELQTWALSLVGDWNTTARGGVTQARSHTAVHEIAAIDGIAVRHDAKGNIVRSPVDAGGTLTTDPAASVYAWDVENRLATATISDPAEGLSGIAAYEYDALGRRVRKHVWGMTTTYLHHGPSVIQEVDSPRVLTGPAETTDGSGAGTPPGGGILASALVRVNFQPAQREIPSGFVADKGRLHGLRTNGRSYGWSALRTAYAVARGEHPFPQFDTFIRLQPAGQPAAAWELALPNGTYPVIVVMGDCASRQQTNHLLIEGVAHSDPDPAVAEVTYERGDFDGYATLATVADGRLTLAAGPGAVDPKLCFVEIGVAGGTIDAATRDRLAARIRAMTVRTGGTMFPPRQATPRQYVLGAGIDEPLALIAGATRYHIHANHVGSVMALTDAAGTVVERYRYDAYGERTVLTAAGVPVASSAHGNVVGFTGRHHDEETGLIHFRARQFSPQLGRFLSRDRIADVRGPRQGVTSLLTGATPALALDGYHDGFSLYRAAFVPLGTDPSGNSWGNTKPNVVKPTCTEGCSVKEHTGCWKRSDLTADPKVHIVSRVGADKVIDGETWDLDCWRTQQNYNRTLAHENVHVTNIGIVVARINAGAAGPCFKTKPECETEVARMSTEWDTWFREEMNHRSKDPVSPPEDGKSIQDEFDEAFAAGLCNNPGKPTPPRPDWIPK